MPGVSAILRRGIDGFLWGIGIPLSVVWKVAMCSIAQRLMLLDGIIGRFGSLLSPHRAPGHQRERYTYLYASDYLRRMRMSRWFQMAIVAIIDLLVSKKYASDDKSAKIISLLR